MLSICQTAHIVMPMLALCDLQALLARRQGAALPLKDFHNDIKRRMILRQV